MKKPLISVVIPTRNAGKGFAQLLSVVMAQSVSGSVAIVVIDSGSTDGTTQLATEFGAQVVPIHPRAFNHGRTRNQAIQAAGGEYVALTVQDAIPADDGWLGRLLEPLLEQPDVAGSYGLQMAGPGSGLLAKTRSSLWYDEHSLPAQRSVQGPEQFWQLSPEERLRLVQFDNVTSCVRRQAWEKTPFPEWDYGEDVGWAKQVLLSGHKTAFVPSACVWHSHDRNGAYELRRAYVEGLTRVQLLDWPSPLLTTVEALAMLRRTAFFLFTRRYDSLQDVDAIHRFLEAELARYRPLDSDAPARTYVAAIEFAGVLTDRAAQFCPDGRFPERAWIHLFRFAIQAVVGQTVGAAAARARPGLGRSEGLAWKTLHKLLHRGF